MLSKLVLITYYKFEYRTPGYTVANILQIYCNFEIYLRIVKSLYKKLEDVNNYCMVLIVYKDKKEYMYYDLLFL